MKSIRFSPYYFDFLEQGPANDGAHTECGQVTVFATATPILKHTVTAALTTSSRLSGWDTH